MKDQVLGVIGGMGPEATALFYEQVISHTVASCDQDHLDMIIMSCASIPDRTQSIKTGNYDEFLQAIHNCLECLERCGATTIAIPCNTSHFFYDTIQSYTKMPIINMPRETVRAAASVKGVHRVGIMGTDGTISSGVYEKACEAYELETVVPDAARQADVMSLIYDDIKAGNPPDICTLDRVLAYFEHKHCDRVILACTELSVIGNTHPMPEYVIDAMDILVRESIQRCGKQYQ